MIAHSVDITSMRQPSAYATVYANSPQADSRPLTVVASASDAPLNGPIQTVDAPQFGDAAPCHIQRGFVDDDSWGSVTASCNGRMVTVGGPVSPAPRQTALWRNSRHAAADRQSRQMLLQFLDTDADAPAQASLLVSVMLLLAALAVFFSATIFSGTRSN